MITTSEKLQKQNKRQELRNKVSYQIKHGSLDRVHLSQSAMEMYLKSIKLNDSSNFGLVKLSKFNLDAAIDGKTLIEHACILKRDSIVSALIRAGADPTISTVNNIGLPNLKIDILNYLWNTYASYAVYLVKLRYDFVASDFLCNNCFATCGEVLRWVKCRHHTCQVCFWKSILNGDKYDDIRCPICSNYYISQNTYSDYEISKNYFPQSKSKFQQLPVDIPKGLKKDPFKGLPVSKIAQLFLGTIQKQRLSIFYESVLMGFYLKVKFLIAAGVDTEIVNEYNQNALSIAVWKGHSKIIALLEICGMRPTSNYGFNASFQFGENIEAFIKKGSCTKLIDNSLYPDHPGSTQGGSYVFDNFFNELFLQTLDSIYHNIVPAPQDHKFCQSKRSYYCDSSMMIQKVFLWILSSIPGIPKDANPYMRFLNYDFEGGGVSPHIDLSRTKNNVNSTHTFILYMSDCDQGGETTLLKSIKEDEVLIAVKPKRGRLLVFPHKCPHEGRKTIDYPKILLRGELFPEC
jgi:ankyrin repeat protein